jgi:hypothetical protein
MEDLNKKALEEARLQNEAKNELYKQMDEFFSKNFIIDENGQIKEKQNDESESAS